MVSRTVKIPQREFHTLMDLMVVDGVPIPVLASAVERVGVQGRDKFGRLRSYQGENDPNIASVLTALVVEFEAPWYAMADWGGKAGTSDASSAEIHKIFCSDEDGFLLWGWQQAALPDFKAIRMDDPPPGVPQNASASFGAFGGLTKGDNYNMVLIGALLEVIDGTAGSSKHSDFEHNRQFAAFLEEQFQGAAGRKDALERKFSNAKTALKNKLNQ
jgi:hypothetical protein